MFFSDIDECQFANACKLGQCKNTVGGYTCTCIDGWKLDASGTACEGRYFLLEGRSWDYFVDFSHSLSQFLAGFKYSYLISA